MSGTASHVDQGQEEVSLVSNVSNILIERNVNDSYTQSFKHVRVTKKQPHGIYAVRAQNRYKSCDGSLSKLL